MELGPPLVFYRVGQTRKTSLRALPQASGRFAAHFPRQAPRQLQNSRHVLSGDGVPIERVVLAVKVNLDQARIKVAGVALTLRHPVPAADEGRCLHQQHQFVRRASYLRLAYNFAFLLLAVGVYCVGNDLEEPRHSRRVVLLQHLFDFRRQRQPMIKPFGLLRRRKPFLHSRLSPIHTLAGSHLQLFAEFRPQLRPSHASLRSSEKGNPGRSSGHREIKTPSRTHITTSFQSGDF